MTRLNHKSFKRKALKNTEVEMEYKALEEEFALIAELIRARKVNGKSQKDVAKAMNTTPSVISRLESGYGRVHHSPSLNTLRRYAAALGCRLMIKLVSEKV